jgi:hypothetical protein
MKLRIRFLYVEGKDVGRIKLRIRFFLGEWEGCGYYQT